MRGRRRATTRRGKGSAAKDLLERDFRATEVDTVWVADITYIATREGFL
jgi:putative transposase